MTVFEGIRLGIQFVCLDIWLFWLIFIIAHTIISRKSMNNTDKKLDEQLELYKMFVKYQKSVDAKYDEVLEKLNSNEEE